MGVELDISVSHRSCHIRWDSELLLGLPGDGGGDLLQFVGAVGTDREQQTSRWPLLSVMATRVLQLSWHRLRHLAVLYLEGAGGLG